MATRKSCPSCRKLLMPGAAFCAYCGTRVHREAAAPSAERVSRNVALPAEKALVAPCTVIVADTRGLDLTAVGRLVAGAFRRPLSDVTREMKFSKGIVASGMSPQDALALARQIGALGTEAFVLGGEDMVDHPPAQRLRRPDFDARGIRGEAYTWDHSAEVDVRWARVFLMAVARVRFAEVVEVPKDEPSQMQKRITPIAVEIDRHIPQLETRAWSEYVLDIVLIDPWERLRMDENSAAYALSGYEQDAHAGIADAVARIHEISHGAPCNRGIELLAKFAPDDAWGSLTFETKQEFDAYLRWILQLTRYGFAIPR